MARFDADICVIGAGSGGLSVAAGAAQMGARVVLIEGGAMGGDCLNVGCVPSKALLAAAKAAKARWPDSPPPVSAFVAAQEHLAAAITQIAPHDSQARFEALGVRVIRGWARFSGRDTVTVGAERIRARRFVIATGSRPVLPPIDGIGAVPVLTNESIFDLTERPAHLLVLGGGPIGLELAQAHRRLGSAVTVVESNRCLAREDTEAAALILSRLRDEGVQIHEGRTVNRISAKDAILLHLGDGSVLSGSHLLVAAGRKPALDDLGLDVAGVACTAQGVTIGRDLRSVSNGRVFAVGDAAGQGQFTHLAGYHAGIVLRRAVLGLPARARTDMIPRVTFTDPEIAQIGMTEAEAKRRYGDSVILLRADYTGNDRAVTEAVTQGFVKLVTRRGRLIGATVAGANAGEVIAPLVLAMASGAKLSTLAALVLPYPTLAELVKRAAGTYFSPKLFDNPALKGWVRLVQRFLP